MIDIEAGRESSTGSMQFQAYGNFVGKEPVIDKNKAAIYHFGTGSARIEGMTIIAFPVRRLWFSCHVHVVRVNTPFLLSIDDTDRLRIHFDSLDDLVVHKCSRGRSKVSRTQDRLFIFYNPHVTCMLTTIRLRRPCRRFRYPCMDEIVKLLERSEMGNIGTKTGKILESIEMECDLFQLYAQKPRHFQFTSPVDNDLNHTVYADTSYIEGKSILHIVDEATNFQGARRLDNMSCETLRRALRM